MSCPRCADSVGICILGLRFYLVASRQANDAVASKQSILRRKISYKSFSCPVNPYIHVPIFRGLDVRGGTKLRTDTHTHTGQLP